MASKVVEISADYDGCFDIISPSNRRGAKMDRMFEFAESIDRLLHTRASAEQLLHDFLDEITADAGGGVILFSGSNRQSPEQDNFNAAQNGHGESVDGLQQLAQIKGWGWDGTLLGAGARPPTEIKQSIVERHCSTFAGTEVEVVVYYFDDIEKYLKHVREHAELPKNIELKTVLFDWYGICIDGSQELRLNPLCRT